MTVGFRAIIALVAAGILYAPSIEAAEPGNVFHIGVLSAGLRSGGVFSREEFRQAFGGAGYVEGKNIVIEERFAEGDTSRLPALVAELVDLKVDLIVTTG